MSFLSLPEERANTSERTQDDNVPLTKPPMQAEVKLTSIQWAQVTLAFLMLLTLFTYYTLQQKNEEVAQTQFEARKVELIVAIEHRLETYTQALRSGLGFFQGSTSVNRTEWHNFVKTLQMQTIFPGIQGLGYTEFIRPEDRGRYEQAIRDEGFPDFTIRPEGARDLYSSITFLEPFDLRNQQAFGYDMYSQETRRSAMDRARDSGKPAISGKVTLVQEITDDVQAGFLIYLPYYGPGEPPSDIEERRKKIIGFVYSPFRMGDLMKGVLGPGIPDMQFQIYDGTTTEAAALMYDTAPTHADQRATAKYSHLIPFRFAQRDWLLTGYSEPSFEKQHDSAEAEIVLVAGLITCLLVFGVQWSFATTCRRAQSLADTMTESLGERTRELSRSNEELERFAYAASHDLRSPLRAIANLATWLEEDLEETLTDDSRKHLVLMRSRITRMDALLEGLLQYSRIGKMTYDVQQIDSGALMQDVIDLASLPDGFSVTVQPDMPVFFAQKTPLLHVFYNLIGNAAKHHDRDTGHIEIKGRDLGSHVSFSVTDDGPGIAKEYHERIFTMFQTLKRRDEIEASGMGLAMVKRYVEEFGGVISVSSSGDTRGSTFRFTWEKTDNREGPKNG